VLLPFIDDSSQSDFIYFICSGLGSRSLSYFILSSEIYDINCQTGKFLLVRGLERVEVPNLRQKIAVDDVRLYLLHKDDHLQLALALEILSNSSFILVSQDYYDSLSSNIISMLNEIVNFSKKIISVPNSPSDWKTFFDYLESNEGNIDTYHIPSNCTLNGYCDWDIASIIDNNIKKSLILNAKSCRSLWLDGMLADDFSSSYEDYHKLEDDVVLDSIKVQQYNDSHSSDRGSGNLISTHLFDYLSL